MKYLSLFSGIEACTVAWKPLGWECAAVAEIEPFPCAVLAHHYQNVPNLGDVTKITEEDIKNLGQIDLVVFGSPCQNLSVAGNRKGLQGESSGLFYEAIRIFEYARKHCNARFALWENVPGSFSSNKGDDFREVVRELSGCGYFETPQNGWGNTGIALGENGLVEWRVLDAQYFGLAQRRKRVFAILDTGNWQDRPPILLEPKSVCGDTPPSRETRQNLAADTQTGVGVQALPINTMTYQGRPSDDGRMGSGIGRENDPIPTLTVNHSHAVVYGFDSRWYNQTPKELCPTLTATDYKEAKAIIIAGNIIGRSPQNGGNGNGFDEEVCYTLTTADRHAVAFSFDSLGSNSMKSANPNSGCREVELAKTLDTTYPCPSKNQGGIAIAHVFKERAGCEGGGKGYMGQDEKAYTLSTSQDQNLLHKSIIRRLTPTECERLQGFPDTYTKIPYRNKPADQCPDSPRYKALGNSMAVPVMQWIGKQIQKAVAA